VHAADVDELAAAEDTDKEFDVDSRLSVAASSSCPLSFVDHDLH